MNEKKSSVREKIVCVYGFAGRRGYKAQMRRLRQGGYARLRYCFLGAYLDRRTLMVLRAFVLVNDHSHNNFRIGDCLLV